MARAKSFFAGITLALIAGCTVSNHRVRPFWNPSWSRLSCGQSSSEAALLLTVAVVDQNGGGLPGVSLNAAGLVTRTDVSDITGAAAFPLPPGEYVLNAKMAGFVTDSTRITLSPNRPCNIKISLAFARMEAIQ